MVKPSAENAQLLSLPERLRIGQSIQAQAFAPKMFAKLLTIIFFWEGLIMVVLAHVKLGNEILEGLIDSGSLTLLAGLSIWFWLYLPTKNRLSDEFSGTVEVYRQLIEAVDRMALVSMTDRSGKITYANAKFCEVSGYTMEELLGQNHRIIKSDAHDKKFYQSLWSEISAGRYWQGEVQNKSKAGKPYWVHAYLIPIHDTAGKVASYLSFRFDITAQKLNEKNLEEERAKNIHLSRLSAIGEMAGGIAHEINNPLAVISGGLSVIERKLKGDDLQTNLPAVMASIAKIQSQVVRITRIIKGLRDFARTDAGNAFEDIPVQQVFEKVQQLMEERLQKAGVRIHYRPVDVVLSCNPVQIEQVLINLIGNSIDALAELSEKWIEVEAQKQGATLEISVVDAGSGISPMIADKLMQPFFTTKPIGQGTGLGLSISKGLIESHGGTFALDSSCAHTRFVIRVPLNSASLKSKEPA